MLSMQSTEGSIIDFGVARCRYGTLRRRLAVCFLWWFSAVFVFYGLAVNAHALAGSLHVNYALLATVQLPALVINSLLLDRVGRRPLLTAALIITSISLIVTSCLTECKCSLQIW